MLTSRLTRSVVRFAAAVTLCATALAAQAPNRSAVIEALRTRIQTDLAADDVGGVTAAIIIGDSIIWSESFGWADRDKRIPASAKTIYRVGSITKTFTAVVLGQLIDRKLISLDDPVEKYVPEIRGLLNPRAGAPPITIRQLASHTAGINREPGNRGAWIGAASDWEPRLLLAIPTTGINAIPGEHFLYSNVGFSILGLAISRAAHVPYAKLVEDGIFKPLGLRSTVGITDAIRPSVAVGYVIQPGGVIDTGIAMGGHNGIGYGTPAGAIYATMGDLARFAASLMGVGKTVVSDSMRRMMMTKQTPEPGPSGYGFGLEVSAPNGGVKVVGHGGVITGYFSAMSFDPESKIGVILLRNYDGTTPLIATAEQTVRALVVERTPRATPLPPLLAGIPETPAGRMLSGWISAINSGDSATISQFLEKAFGRPPSPQSIAREKAQGGYDVRSVEESDYARIVVLARERADAKIFVRITMAVRPESPDRLMMLGTAIAEPPPGFAPPPLTAAEQAAARAGAPFGRFSAWLDAFNSGELARMQEFIDANWPGANPTAQMTNRDRTGGYDLVTLEHATARTVAGTVKERKTGNLSRFVVTIEPAQPVRIIRIALGAPAK